MRTSPGTLRTFVLIPAFPFGSLAADSDRMSEIGGSDEHDDDEAGSRDQARDQA